MPVLVNPAGASVGTTVSLAELEASAVPFIRYAGGLSGALGAGFSLGAGATAYCCPMGDNVDDAGSSANGRSVSPTAGTLKRFRVKVSGIVAATTTVTVGIYVNGFVVATATYADTDAAGTEVTGTITTAPVAAEDDIQVRITHNNGSARTCHMEWTFDLENA